MAQQNIVAEAGFAQALPTVRRIGVFDLWNALAKGLDDFRAMPSHAFFLGVLYPIVGLVLGRLAFGYDVLPLLFPLAAGFALIGPFAALAFYEMSRRRERGLDLSWRNVLAVAQTPSIGGIILLGLALLLLFAIWIMVAHGLYEHLFGATGSISTREFLHNVFETPEGRTLMIVGNAVGALFALAAFVISVVSFPLLLDREIGAAGAVVTSIRAVLANPVVMALWGAFVALALVSGSLPLFMGLAVVVPVLGHATWHLYRKVIE